MANMEFAQSAPIGNDGFGMAANSATIHQFLHELKELSCGWHPQRWQQLREQIAGLLITVLHNDKNKLTRDLTDLKASAVKLRPRSILENPSTPFNQNRRFFTPVPGSVNFEFHRFWRLQLLLYTAAKSSNWLHLTELLQLSANDIKEAVAEAESMATTGIGLWSKAQHLEYLGKAVRLLEIYEQKLELSADFRVLTYGGHEAKLTHHQGQLMRLLLAHRPNPVPHNELKSAGVSNLAKAKERLVRQAARYSIALNVVPIAGTYALLPPAPV